MPKINPIEEFASGSVDKTVIEKEKSEKSQLLNQNQPKPSPDIQKLSPDADQSSAIRSNDLKSMFQASQIQQYLDISASTKSKNVSKPMSLVQQQTQAVNHTEQTDSKVDTQLNKPTNHPIKIDVKDTSKNQPAKTPQPPTKKKAASKIKSSSTLAMITQLEQEAWCHQ